MIPKIIHYCWFGNGEKSKLAQKCIASWKKYCPDYEIIEWNEDNFNFDAHPYTQWCYHNKKWAFLSDYVRLWAVINYGGIYFDTDVEVVRSFDPFLNYDAFYGFENSQFVTTGLGFGAVQNHVTTQAMLKLYDNLVVDQDNIKTVGCPILNTEALLPFGLLLDGNKQQLAGAVILPIDYLNPLEDSTGIVRKTKNTMSIHWYAKSALDKKTVLRSKITRPLHRWFGKNCFKKMKAWFNC